MCFASTFQSFMIRHYASFIPYQISNDYVSSAVIFLNHNVKKNLQRIVNKYKE